MDAGHRSQQPGQHPEGVLTVYKASSEETTPLLPGRKPQGAISRDGLKLILYGVVAVLALLFAMVNLFLHFTNCPLYPETMNAIRRDWQKEEMENEVVREGWRLEQLRHDVMEEEWKRQEEWYETEIARLIQWYKDTERHEDQRQEKVREEWQKEVEDHDKIVEERKKREEEERQKLNMFWGNVQVHRCITYGTREYTAQLMNLPVTWEHRVEACKATAIEIHGRLYLPTSCEDKGPGVVLGRWEVNQQEPYCAPLWTWYKDKGCTSHGSGKRLIDHYLENIPEGGDWREFCATTPIDFDGMTFEGAQQCFQHNGGTHGHWEIEDASCS